MHTAARKATAANQVQSSGYQRWQHLTEWPLLAVAVLFAAAYSWQLLGDPREEIRVLLRVVIQASWVIFAIDYLVRLALARNRLRWFGRNLLLLAVVALPILRPLRLIRLFTIFSVFQRTAGAKLRGQVVVYAISSTLVLVYVGSLAVYDAERHAHGASITSFGRALWWAVVTITTVGYGDLVPVTPDGRFVASGLMIAGIALLGTVTATIASWLVDNVSERDDQAQAAEVATRIQVEELAEQVMQLRLTVAELLGQRSEPSAADG